jgi:hypothetical protein
MEKGRTGKRLARFPAQPSVFLISFGYCINLYATHYSIFIAY